MRAVVVAALLCGAGSARADYESHPALHPSERCEGLEDSSSPTGYGPDCQPLFWDLEPATSAGQKALATLDEPTGFPGGMTDRPPPLYTDGVEGYEQWEPGWRALCPLRDESGNELIDPAVADPRDPDVIPYWKPTGETETVDGPFGPREAEIFEVTCARGTRAYFGPWFVGEGERDFDEIAFKIVKFENSGRLDRDVEAELIFPNERRELNSASEIFTHVGNHHGNCDISVNRCNDPNEPEYASSEACDSYRALAEQCPAEGESTECPQFDFYASRTLTARQGRYSMTLPEGRTFGLVEDPLWLCQNHVINDEPPSYGSSKRRNFRNQNRGAVGEMVLQILTEPFSEERFRPINVTFDFIASKAVTYVPPYTMSTQDTIWYAPFDLAVGLATQHSHENAVRVTMEVLPAGAPRPNATRPECGGALSPYIYESYSYFEPTVCEYWRDTDGPIILRKGQAIRVSCLVNNGFTPTQQIDEPGVREFLEVSPLGEMLYGRQPPSSYRVQYGCERITGIPPGSFNGGAARVCPRPATDEEGGWTDGPYEAPDHCPPAEGYTGRCVPATAVFANTTQDAMCIPMLLYWPLDRVLEADGSIDEEAMERLMAGDVDQVGLPGRIPKSPSDAGFCHDGASGDGVHGDDPNPFPQARSRNCRAGL